VERDCEPCFTQTACLGDRDSERITSQVSIERSDMVFAERSQRLDHWLGEVRFLSRLPN